jgi:hypothetical protein
MRLTSRFVRRADRSPWSRSIRRHGALTVETLEHRVLLSPLPAQPTSLSLVVGSGVYGGTATLTATLTAGNAPLAGATVGFALNEAGIFVDVGSATTDANGLATLPGVALTGFNAAIFKAAVEASFAGDGTDAASLARGALFVSPAPATLNLGGLVTTYDGMAQAASLTTTPAGLAGASLTYTQNNLAVAAPTTPGSYTVTATLQNPNYSAAVVTGTLIINQATPAITWPDPADIVYGTPLGPQQLDATSSIAGTFAYTQAAGLILNGGAAQTLSGTFTPIDTVDYSSVTTSVTINVLPAMPMITWPDPADIVYGTPLGPDQLDALASIPGIFTYTPTAGVILSAGVAQTLSATFTPLDSTDYSAVTTTTTLNVLPTSPVITWTNPPAIVYGTPLSAAELDATASTPGTFIYTPAPGTVLSAGADQALSVSFVPDDTADYGSNTSTASVVLNVVPAPLTVTVNDATRVYGQANPDFSAHFSGFVDGDTPGVLGGALGFSTSATPASDVGTYNVLSSGLTSSNYAISLIPGTLSITPADQTITWPSPADIIYGTPLSATQLDATVSVVGPAPAGALSYALGEGTILGAGDDQMLTVVAAATDDYNQASATVTLNVAKATPAITWANPADVVYGTPLGAAQLDASISVPDPAHVTLDYSPPTGTVLHAGSGQILRVSTSATANDNAATVTVTINVLPATPTITWANPADIVYGTPLGPAQLDATASTAGTFAYTPAAGDVLEVGPGQPLEATFTPVDPADFQSVMISTAINVQRAPLVVTASDAATTYGAAIPVLTGSVVGLQNNDPVGVNFATNAAVGSPVGTYTIVPALFDPNHRMGNYQIEIDPGKLTVSPALLTVIASSARITVGQAIPAFNASYNGFLLGDGPNVLGGTLTFSVPAGAGSQPGQYPIMPGGLTVANYAISYVDGFLNVVAQPASAAAVTVQNVRWRARSLGHKQTVKVVAVTFSAALDPSTAQDASAYHLVAISRSRKIGPGANKPIPIASATYNPATYTVTLTPRGKLPNQALQLAINTALVRDPQGQPIDGNLDGQPGGNFVANVGS